jgi:hypothetical protein
MIAMTAGIISSDHFVRLDIPRFDYYAPAPHHCIYTTKHLCAEDRPHNENV